MNMQQWIIIQNLRNEDIIETVTSKEPEKVIDLGVDSKSDDDTPIVAKCFNK